MAKEPGMSTAPPPGFEQTPAGLLVRAPAKVNLNLLVGPRRTDGFHDLDSLVVKISLHDELLLSRGAGVPPAPSDEDDLASSNDQPYGTHNAGRMPAPRRDTVLLSCEGADCGEVENNLVYRAARLLQSHVRETGLAKPGDNLSVRIHLTKRTPPGKGLGGGSSDAAATLTGLWRLWGLDRTDDRTAQPSAVLPAALATLAAQLGSDVPLFLTPNPCRMTGRGDILQPLDITPLSMVLFLPDLFCATPAVYRTFDQLAASRGAGVSPALGGEIGLPSVNGLACGTSDAGETPAPQPAHPLAERQLDDACLRLPPSRWRHRLTNDLFPPACRVCPELATLHGRLQAHTDIPILMTGSGSALFAPCDNDLEAARLLHALPPNLRQRGIIVQTVA